MDEPLTRAQVESILRTNVSGNLVRRESSTLELKESFNWGSRAKYAKTIAAFANARGGYIVFGVKDSPHKLVGLKSKNFESLDDADITQYLNEHFDHELRIERRIFEASGIEFGVVYVYESARKPVICTKNAGDELREGDIYYRYRATSRRIRHSELRLLIDEEAQRLHDRLLETVMRVGKIGVGNAAILDTKAGVLHAPDGMVIVDQSILDQVDFIREGQFDERDGDPTLRVVSDAIGAQVVTHERAVALRTPEIIGAFFGKKLPGGANARDVLDALAYEPSSYVPKFFFAREAGLSDEEAAAVVEAAEATGRARVAVAEQLRHGASCADKGSIRPGSSPVAGRRAQLLDSLVAGALDQTALSESDLSLVLEAMTHMSSDQIRASFDLVIETLESLYPRTRDYPLKQVFGQAVCHVDEALYRERVQGS
jgi:hypothetical protein